jgi:ribonuclease BN (tRNA processing enzyme)
MFRPILASLLALMASSTAVLAQSCTGSPVAVQILGSGGPALNRERASTAYVLWSGGQAKILVDMGGGSFARFAQSQAKFSDLSMILISHLHPDHTSDLPALMWSSRGTRSDRLPVFGPSGNEAVPSLPIFLSRLFDEKNGAFQVLGPIMASAPENGGVVHLDATAIDVTKTEPTAVIDRDGIKVTAMGIPHANIPALAYRVETRGVSVVFSTDQNGTNPRFPTFAKGANVLIMHMAIAAGASSPLHAAPAVVGRIAQSAGVGRLVVSHIGQYDLDAALAELKGTYSGPLTVGADLQCTPIQ